MYFKSICLFIVFFLKGLKIYFLVRGCSLKYCVVTLKIFLGPLPHVINYNHFERFPSF